MEVSHQQASLPIHILVTQQVYMYLQILITQSVWLNVQELMLTKIMISLYSFPWLLLRELISTDTSFLIMVNIQKPLLIIHLLHLFQRLPHLLRTFLLWIHSTIMTPQQVCTLLCLLAIIIMELQMLDFYMLLETHQWNNIHLHLM